MEEQREESWQQGRKRRRKAQMKHRNEEEKIHLEQEEVLEMLWQRDKEGTSSFRFRGRR